MTALFEVAPGLLQPPKTIGVAADHGGFELKESMVILLKQAGYAVVDFGAHRLVLEDDYPDFVLPLAEAVAMNKVDRGIAICGSGVGASVAANKVPGVRAALMHDHFSAHQGVEDDAANILCLGGRVVGHSIAWELVTAFLQARFTGAERHVRRLTAVAKQEAERSGTAPASLP